MVKPGASLSLQKHHHRAEHWVVVVGTAEVTCGDRRLLLSENQSTYIPLGRSAPAQQSWQGAARDHRGAVGSLSRRRRHRALRRQLRPRLTKTHMDGSASIFVSGHRGMVGSAIVRRLQARGYRNLLLRTRDELDLLDQTAVHAFLRARAPRLHATSLRRRWEASTPTTCTAPISCIRTWSIEANLIHGAHLAGVQRLMFLGSQLHLSARLPAADQGRLSAHAARSKPTNEPYAIAKIAGIKLCESYNRQYGRQYVCVMPTNLYGPNDNYDLANSHVLPALIRKAHEAKQRGDAEYVVWGSGTPRREFLYVDDLADACVHLMRAAATTGRWSTSATGEDVTIRELAEIGDGRGRASRPHRLRQQQARRHAAQAAGREPLGGAGLARPHAAARRHSTGLRERAVPRAQHALDSDSRDIAP